MRRIAFIMVFLLESLSLLAQTGINAGLAQRLEQHVVILTSDSMEGRGLGTAGKIAAFNYIAGEFRSIGLLPYNDEGYFQHFDLYFPMLMVPGTNIVGYLNGSDPGLQDEYILIGAHYDHLGYEVVKNDTVIYRGADDNASGVAVLIELARYFALNPQLLERSIIFVAFDAEEIGLMGSRKFVDENRSPDIKDIRAMFSIDRVGMYGAYMGLNLKGIATIHEGEGIARSVASDQGIRLKYTSGDIGTNTDTWTFSEKGIPSVWAFSSAKAPYHKSEDTYEKLDYDGMAKVANFMATLIIELSAMEELGPSPRYTRLQKPFAFQFNAGITGAIGSSHHHYPEEFFTAKSLYAYNAGCLLQFHFGKRITLQPEVLYQSDGSKSAEGDFRRESISIPVNLHYNLVSKTDIQLKVFPLTGVYYKKTFTGKNGGKELDFDQKYNDVEWGCNIGAGLDIRNLLIIYTWQRSFTNLLQTDENIIIPSGWYISLGLKF